MMLAGCLFCAGHHYAAACGSCAASEKRPPTDTPASQQHHAPTYHTPAASRPLPINYHHMPCLSSSSSFPSTYLLLPNLHPYCYYLINYWHSHLQAQDCRRVPSPPTPIRNKGAPANLTRPPPNEPWSESPRHIGTLPRAPVLLLLAVAVRSWRHAACVQGNCLLLRYANLRGDSHHDHPALSCHVPSPSPSSSVLYCIKETHPFPSTHG
jgi:hypothetical protein